MRSYFCEEEIFPNDLSRVNKSFQLFERMRLILVNKKGSMRNTCISI